MECTKCGGDLGGPRQAQGGIAVLVNGNEVIHSYFRCDDCGAWSVEHYADDFMTGDSSIWTSGPFTEEEGQRVLELIEECPNPQDKFCRCASHSALYRGLPPAD